MKTSTTGNDFQTELLAAILNCGIQDISIIKEWQEKYQIDAMQVIFELHQEYLHPDFRAILIGIANKRHYSFLEECEQVLRTRKIYEFAEEELDVCINWVACSYQYDHPEVQVVFEQYQANNYQTLA